MLAGAAADAAAARVIHDPILQSSEQTTQVLGGAVQAKAERQRTHLRSGSPCLHTGSCWKSDDWAKGGRRGSKVKLKKKITQGLVEKVNESEHV